MTIDLVEGGLLSLVENREVEVARATPANLLQLDIDWLG